MPTDSSILSGVVGVSRVPPRGAENIWNANPVRVDRTHEARRRLGGQSERACRPQRARVETHLVGGGELRPRFIGPAVVVLRVRGLHVLVEAQDLPGLQFGHRGSLGELRAEEEAAAADY